MTSIILNIIKAALISARDIPVLGLLVVADSQNLILCKAHFKNVMEHVKKNRQRMELKHQISQIIDKEGLFAGGLESSERAHRVEIYFWNYQTQSLSHLIIRSAIR